MMTGLDNRTLLLLAGSFYLLLPLSVWIVLRQPRETAARLWCSGGMLGGLGLILIGLRGQVPDLASYALGQPLLALGALLVAQSLRMDIHRPWLLKDLMLGALLYGLSLALLQPRVPAHVLGAYIRLVNLGSVLLLIHAAWQVAHLESSRNARTIGLAYLLQAVGIGSNLMAALRGSADIQTLTSAPVPVAASLLTLLVALVASMAYLGLALERSLRCQLTLGGEKERERQWHARRQALIELDRERLLVVLSDSLGHALTQPLTAAGVRLQLAQRWLRNSPTDTASLREALRQLSGQLRRAGATIERIRQLVRPSASSVSTLDLVRVLDDVHKMVQQEAIHRGARMRFPKRQGPLLIAGDAIQISQAVLQLVRNALAAVDGQTEQVVTVELQTNTHEARVSVTDSGPGFAHALLQRSHGTAQPNHLQGIGLFVVQSIVRQHGGRLLLENSYPKGATATLVLQRDPSPLRQDEHQSPQRLTADPVSRHDKPLPTRSGGGD